MNPGELAAALQLTRPLVFLDVETTTPPGALEPDAKVDRVVELGVLKVYPDGKVTQFATLVNPGIPISPDTTAVHGKTDQDVATAPTFAAIARGVYAGLDGCDLVGFNARRYDVPVIRREFLRCGIIYDPDQVHVVDPYLLWAKMRPRDLAAWVKQFLGLEHDGHQAGEDVAAVVLGLLPFLDAFSGELPRTVPELGALCARPRNPNWIDPDGKVQWRGDVPTVCFGKYEDQPMASVPTDYWDYIVRKDFSPEVQALAREAQRGRYPVRGAPAGPVLVAEPTLFR